MELKMKRYMSRNMSDGDRAIRTLIGAILIGAVMISNGATLAWPGVLILLAIPLLITAIIGWDPLYALMNINTRKMASISSLGIIATRTHSDIW